MVKGGGSHQSIPPDGVTAGQVLTLLGRQPYDLWCQGSSNRWRCKERSECCNTPSAHLPYRRRFKMSTMIVFQALKSVARKDSRSGKLHFLLKSSSENDGFSSLRSLPNRQRAGIKYRPTPNFASEQIRVQGDTATRCRWAERSPHRTALHIGPATNPTL